MEQKAAKKSNAKFVRLGSYDTKESPLWKNLNNLQMHYFEFVQRGMLMKSVRLESLTTGPTTDMRILTDMAIGGLIPLENQKKR